MQITITLFIVNNCCSVLLPSSLAVTSVVFLSFVRLISSLGTLGFFCLSAITSLYCEALWQSVHDDENILLHFFLLIGKVTKYLAEIYFLQDSQCYIFYTSKKCSVLTGSLTLPDSCKRPDVESCKLQLNPTTLFSFLITADAGPSVMNWTH